MSGDSAHLHVVQLTKRYGAVEALRGVTFSAQPGQIFGLLGPNGAGKTTTLECVLGLRQPDGGRVIVAGIDAAAEPERARALLGAQLQSSALQDKLTARQALRLFGGFYAVAAPVSELLADFGLEEKADAPFSTLSGGQRQRLFLALAFVHRPRIVVLDEPTTGLDPQARRELHGVLTAARGRGVTLILSTHDLHEAESLCDRIGILHDGRVIAEGRPAELVARCARQPRVLLRTSIPLAVEHVRRIDGVSAHERPAPDRLELACADVNRAVMGIARAVTEAGAELIDLQIVRPTLEDAYFELTGTVWKESAA